MILVGKAGSGKDTFASMFPYLKRFAFADELKKVVRIAQIDGAAVAQDYLVARTGILDSHMYPILKFASTHKTTGKQRKVLQIVGQGLRNIEPDIWVNLLVDNLKRANNPPHIITDCRYMNEFNAFRDEFSVFLYASRKVRIKRMVVRDGKVDYKTLSHPSEKYVDLLGNQCLFRINNSKLILTELRRKATIVSEKRDQFIKQEAESIGL